MMLDETGRPAHSSRVKRLAIFLLAGASVVLAENPPPDPSLCGPYPKLYKEIIWNWLQTALLDASSAKIDWEGDPKPADLGTNGQHLYGWRVDFKVNSRNRFGAYTGKQGHGVLIRDEQVVKGIGFGY
jgi:hypothetical protein